MPNRGAGGVSYRYGFNGKETENDVKGIGNEQDYGMRIYDPRLGRFLSVDPLSKKFTWYSPYQFAGNTPVWAIDIDGLEEKPSTHGTKEREKTVTEGKLKYAPSDCNCVEADEGYRDKKEWFWYSGNLQRKEKAGWYSETEYYRIVQDWEHGQVLQPESYFAGQFGSEEHGLNGSRNWYGFEVNNKGYLTGKKFQRIQGSAGGLEAISPTSELKILYGAKLLEQAPSLFRVGEYTIYYGYKLEKNSNELLLYIGKAKDGILARYSSAERAELAAKAFKGLEKVPSNGIALGIEQRIMELNGWEGKASNAYKPVLSNINNATIKDIYLKAADDWLNTNIPDW